MVAVVVVRWSLAKSPKVQREIEVRIINLTITGVKLGSGRIRVTFYLNGGHQSIFCCKTAPLSPNKRWAFVKSP